MLDKYTAVSKETGEILEIEEVIKKYLNSNNASIVSKSKSLSELFDKLKNNPYDLTTNEITRIAKANKNPIDSFRSFFTVNLTSHYFDLDLSSISYVVFGKMLKLLNAGHKIEKYGNNKKIKNLEDFYNSIDISKTTFYKIKKELEDKRLIKILETDDRVLILLNPVYIRCGKMDSVVFYEFEREIREVNPLEWLFFLKKFNMGNSILLKNENPYKYKGKICKNYLQAIINE